MSPGWIAGILLLSVGLPGGDPPPAERASADPHGDALARYGAGIWQARRNRLLSAARAFEAAARQDPEATAPLKELVRTYALIGREPDAIRVARTILERDPNDADAAQVLARLLSEAGELQEAVVAAKLAAEHVNPTVNPEKAIGVHRDLATLLERSGDPGSAAAALQKALDILLANRKAAVATRRFTPKETDALTAETFERLGNALGKKGQTDAAVQAFRSAHALYADPTRADDRAAAARLDWNLSGVYATKGETAAALTHLEAFLKLQPQAVEPYERFAALLVGAGRSGEAIARLQKYADREPGNLSLQVVLAAERARDLSSRQQADADFARLSAATNDPNVVRVAIRSHVETGRAGQVIADLDKAYLVLTGAATGEKHAFAAEKARVIAEILRADLAAANAVLRAGADDLRMGTTRTHQTWSLLGILAARHNKLDLAAVQFRQAVRNAPREPRGAQAEAYHQLIAILRQSRKPADVAAVCRDAIREGVSDLPVGFNYYLAQALAELGDADEAIAAADAAIRQAGDANRLVTRLNKASVLGLLGRWDDAVGLCQKLLDEFDTPGDQSRIRYALAHAYWGAKKYPESEAELRTILDADPDHAGACNDLGYHLAEQGRNLDEAERLLRHAIAIDRADRRRSGDPETDNAAYLDSLAWVLFHKGLIDPARQMLEKAAGMPEGATDPIVWDHLGDVLFRAGEKGKAKAAWERAAEFYTTNPRDKREGRLDEVKRKLKRIS
jgi:tetratricopeptide (TPR) repeat protein